LLDGVAAGIAVLREVERGRVPAAVARRARLVALRAEALALVHDEGLVQAGACWQIVALDAAPGAPGELRLGGERLPAPRLVPVAGRLTAVACAAATIGPAVEQRAARLFAERRAALALALDGVANELLFALSRRLQDRLAAEVRRRRLTLSGELRAGDPGLALQAQAAVLRLASAARIGIGLTATMMMTPAKSTSFVQGVGEALPAQAWSRCDDCRSRPRCTLAAEAAPAVAA
jgi:hypothetical protein